MSTTPRPWYCAITALLSDSLQMPALSEAMGTFELESNLPGHHMKIHPRAWHFTVFALLAMNDWPDKVAVEGQEAINRHLSEIAENTASELRTKLAKQPALTFEAYEVSAFDTVTALQFREHGSCLSTLRDQIRKIVADPILAICEAANANEYATEWQRVYAKPLVQSLIEDPNKNSGGNAFASVARAPLRSEALALRWRQQIVPVTMHLHSLRLTSSDEFLTNPTAHESPVVLKLAR
jgi:hypothetical protein